MRNKSNSIFGLAILISVFFVAGCDSSSIPKNVYEEAVGSKERSKKNSRNDVYRKPVQVLTYSGLKAGMSVADISAGTGYYTELFSSIVGDSGKVYLHNKPSYLKRADKKALIDELLAKSSFANTKLVSGKLDNLQLPSKVDLIFISKIFHDLYNGKNREGVDKNVKAFLSELRRNLNDDGVILIIDHSASNSDDMALNRKLHRIEESVVKEIFESNGFEFVSSSEVLRNKEDTKELSIWDSKISKKTDRFVFKFKKK